MAKPKKRKIKKKGLRVFLPFFLCVALLLSIMAVPSTILLAVGMLPTLSAFMFDRTHNKTKTVAVGAMNLAFCMFYLTNLWSGGNTISVSLSTITDPVAIIVMYTGAVVGYFIDWLLSGLSSSVLYKKTQRRQKAIIEKQGKLRDRWGQKVTGSIPLNKDGFPVLQSNKKDS